jgi:hypothetical protein
LARTVGQSIRCRHHTAHAAPHQRAARLQRKHRGQDAQLLLSRRSSNQHLPYSLTRDEQVWGSIPHAGFRHGGRPTLIEALAGLSADTLLGVE